MSIRLLVQPKRSALWYRRTTCAARTRQFVWRFEWERGQCDVRVPDRGDGARDDRVVGEFDRLSSISGGVRGGLMVMSITRVLPLVGRGRSRKYMENATTTATSRQTIHSRGSLGSGRTTAGMLRSSKKHTRNTRATCCSPNLSALTAYPHYHAKCLTAVPRRAGHTSRAPAPSATSAASLFHEGKLSPDRTLMGRCSPHLSALGLSLAHNQHKCPRTGRYCNPCQTNSSVSRHSSVRESNRVT